MSRERHVPSTPAEVPDGAPAGVPSVAPSGVPQRRRATILEAKAASHPLRLRILRLCSYQALTNKELADRLGSQPGTVHYHVRLLVTAGLLEPAPVRTGASGALEKPYRSAGSTWWLDGPLADAGPVAAFSPIEAFQEELREAGPASVRFFERFMLHLSPEDAVALDLELHAVLDEYVRTDDERLDQPVHGGIVVVHRLADQPD